MLTDKEKSGCYIFFSYLFLISIPLFIFLAIVASYFHYLPFKVELQSVIIIGIIFFIYILFIPHNAFYSACKIKDDFPKMEKSLKDSIRQTLLKINGARRSTLKIEDFFKNYYVGIRNDNFASVAVTIFPMLGILGTFISIAISMPDFSVSSTQDLDQEISTLLSGVGTAFYASIYGIFLSIWWIIFEKRGLSKIDNYSKMVKKAYQKYLWDDTMLQHYLYAQNQMHNDELVSALKENFNIHFMKQFNDAYLDTYQTLLKETTSSFHKISENIQEASNQIIKDLQTVSNAKNVIKASENIDKRMIVFNNSIHKLDNALENSLIRVDEEVGMIVRNLADFAEIVVKKSNEVEESLDKYQKEIKRVIKA